MPFLRRIVFFMILVIGCTMTHTTHLVEGPQPDGLRYHVLLGKKDNQDKLEQLVKETVALNFGNVDNIHTTVWWVEGDLIWWATDDDNNRLDYKTRYWGLTFSCDEIYVLDRADSVCGTSYIHELIHCYHAHVEGYRDFKHKNKKWWDLVKPLQEECYRLGW